MSEVLPNPSTPLENDSFDGSYIIYLTKLHKKSETSSRRRFIARRNRFIDRYFWRPHWQAEVTTAITGLNERVSEAYERYGLKKAYFVWNNAQKYRNEASAAFVTLQRVRDPNLSDLPDANAIRADEEVLRPMAEYLWATNQLDNLDSKNFQPHRVKGKPNAVREAELQKIISEIRVDNKSDKGNVFQNDAEVVGLWYLARGSEEARSKFWDRQLQDVSGTPIVREILEAIEHAEIVTEADAEEYLKTFPEDYFPDGKI